MAERRFVRRDEKVSFMDIGDGVYRRMKFFTAMGEDKNPIEHTRRYTDESFERVDVVGISAGISFSMDQRLGDPVHEIIVDIFDNEKLGDDASIRILSVDFTKPIESEDLTIGYAAKRRDFSLIPGSEGGDAEAYSYEGSLRVKGETDNGEAVFTLDAPIGHLEECSFVEGV